MTTDELHEPKRIDSPTERRLPDSMDIDRLSSLEILQRINTADNTVPAAVRELLPALAPVVDRAVDAIARNGRVHYFGAGTSGRFGVLDAAEVRPTFGVDAGVFIAHLAGGAPAMTEAAEAAEDDHETGALEARASVHPGDIVIGIAASGSTPYVAGALAGSRALGAFTVALSSNPGATIADHADVHLCASTGPEVITGSTRMKAGTAQKLVLNSFSTAVMIRLGRTYSNLMIDVVATNDKLRHRVVNLLREATGADNAAAAAALDTAAGETRVARAMLLTGESVERARDLLDGHRTVHSALVEHRRTTPAPRPKETARHGFVGVDVGASGFRVTMLRDGEFGTERPGPTRPFITTEGLDLRAVIEAALDVIAELRDETRWPLAGIGLGVAGALTFPGLSEALEHLRAASRIPLVVGVPDGYASYVGACGLERGAVLAAGTGAVAVATDGETEWRQVDGLGHVLGDYGSGAWLGQRALAIAAREQTGRAPLSTALTEAAERRFGSISELITHVHGSSNRSAVLASFVPDLISIADSDPVAAALVDEAATELATTLVSAADGITTRVAAVGGLVNPQGPLRDALRGRLELLGYEMADAHGTAAQGAATVAHAVAAHDLPKIFAQRALVLSD